MIYALKVLINITVGPDCKNIFGKSHLTFTFAENKPFLENVLDT